MGIVSLMGLNVKFDGALDARGSLSFKIDVGLVAGKFGAALKRRKS
jgi:hypothetical protein